MGIVVSTHVPMNDWPDGVHAMFGTQHDVVEPVHAATPAKAVELETGHPANDVHVPYSPLYEHVVAVPTPIVANTVL